MPERAVVTPFDRELRRRRRAIGRGFLLLVFWLAGLVSGFWVCAVGH